MELKILQSQAKQTPQWHHKNAIVSLSTRSMQHLEPLLQIDHHKAALTRHALSKPVRSNLRLPQVTQPIELNGVDREISSVKGVDCADGEFYKFSLF